MASLDGAEVEGLGTAVGEVGAGEGVGLAAGAGVGVALTAEGTGAPATLDIVAESTSPDLVVWCL